MADTVPLPQPTPIKTAFGGSVLAYGAEDMRSHAAAQSAADNAALRKQLNAAKIIIAGQDERSIHWAREHGELMQRASDVAGERAANAILTDENAALRAELAKHQESEFHPDWSMLSATRDSLAEHQDMIRRLSERVKVLEDELGEVLEWAAKERAPLRDQEIASIRRALEATK